MADYRILIQVDPYTQAFTYTGPNGEDFSNIGAPQTKPPLKNGDRFVWILDPLLPGRTFQIDFDVPNPFHPSTALSFRGSDFILSPPITLRPTYTGLRDFEYSVFLDNGWHDDPHCQVVPEPPNGFGEIVPPVSITIDISWTDSTESTISLTPASSNNPPPAPPPVTVQSAGTPPLVTWQWDTGQPDTSLISLTFVTPPWPNVSNAQSIPLTLPAGQSAFTVSVITPDGTTATATGYLVVL